jgi:phosphotransferase system IIA component
MALFSRKKQITIHASTTGQVIVLEKVNDPVFSQK